MWFFFLFVPFLSLFAQVVGDEVERRGFIIKDEEGRYYLSSLPGIRSCCIGKKGDQIRLKGDFSSYSPYSAVTLKGELIEDSDGTVLVVHNFAVENGGS